MKKTNFVFTLATVGCILFSIVFGAVAVIRLVTGSFPLGYAVEAFTTDQIGVVILFLAAAAEIVNVILTRIVMGNFEKYPLISRGTIFTGMAFVALVFVFQQNILPILLWLLGAAVSVATLASCSDIVNPRKETLE